MPNIPEEQLNSADPPSYYLTIPALGDEDDVLDT